MRRNTSAVFVLIAASCASNAPEPTFPDDRRFGCSNWLTLPTESRSEAVAQVADRSIEVIRSNLAEVGKAGPRVEDVLDQIRACLKGREPSAVGEMTGFCSASPNGDYDDMMTKAAEISQYCGLRGRALVNGLN